MNRPLVIGVTLGDPTGIGPEVTFKAIQRLATEASVRFVVYGDRRIADAAARYAGWISSVPEVSECSNGGDSVRVCLDSSAVPPLPPLLPVGAPAAALAAVAWLRQGGLAARAGVIDALVTGPVNKEAIIRAGVPFVGQTEFLAALCDAQRYAMMLLGEDDRGRWLRVALATTHIALANVPGTLTPESIVETIELAAEACRLLGLPRQRVGVCGLNPHAGEGGAMGTEEISIVAPGIALARDRGADAMGPVPGDTIFYQALRGQYDVVVAMYHDQGLAPLKTVAFDTGINWTLGLPIIRTSPDHGTAYDIAGQGLAHSGSMECAIRLAIQLALMDS